MPTTMADLHRFHQFATDKIASGNADLDLDELMMLWYDAQEGNDVNSIIQQGLADIAAGRGRPAREVMEELRQKYDLPTE